MPTLRVQSYSQIPMPMRQDCMERLSEGVFKHHRLGITFVVLNEIIDQEHDAVAPLMDAVIRYQERLALEEIERPRPRTKREIALDAVREHRENKLMAIRAIRLGWLSELGVNSSLREALEAYEECGGFTLVRQ